MKWDNAEKEVTWCLGKNRYEVDSRRWDREELAPSALDKRSGKEVQGRFIHQGKTD